MRKLVVIVLVLAAVVGVAELFAPSWVASQVEDTIQEETDQQLEVEAEVSGPPLLIPVALDGTVDAWTLRLARVGDEQVPVDVVVELDDVVLDRGRLVRGDVRVIAIDRARATITVDLSDTIPPALQPFADRFAEVGLDRLLDAVGDGALARDGSDLSVGGQLDLPLVEGSCTITSDEAMLVVQCDLAEVPSLLLSAFD